MGNLDLIGLAQSEQPTDCIYPPVSVWSHVAEPIVSRYYPSNNVASNTLIPKVDLLLRHDECVRGSPSSPPV